MKNSGFEKMLEMITAACEQALGAEWLAMDDKQKHDTVMGFIAEAARQQKAEQQ